MINLCYCFQLVVMDALFCEPDNSEHKHRRSSLEAALIKSLPKPDGLKTVAAITTARGALLQLADYALWQFFVVLVEAAAQCSICLIKCLLYTILSLW